MGGIKEVDGERERRRERERGRDGGRGRQRIGLKGVARYKGHGACSVRCENITVCFISHIGQTLYSHLLDCLGRLILILPRCECCDYLTNVDERARFPHYHFVPQGHRAIYRWPECAEHL